MFIFCLTCSVNFVSSCCESALNSTVFGIILYCSGEFLFYLVEDTEILQIGAWCGSKSWMKYVLPTKRISPSASAVNKLTFVNGQLLLNGQPVNAIPAQDALADFCKFVENCGSKVILAAHNGKAFDFKRYVCFLHCVKKQHWCYLLIDSWQCYQIFCIIWWRLLVEFSYDFRGQQLPLHSCKWENVTKISSVRCCDGACHTDQQLVLKRFCHFFLICRC